MLRNCWANFAPFSGLGCSWQRVGDDECFVSSFIGIAHLPMSPASSRTPWWRDPPNLVSERTQATLHQQSQAFYLADHVSGMGPGMGPEGTQEETCLGNAWEKSDLHANKNGAPKILFFSLASWVFPNLQQHEWLLSNAVFTCLLPRRMHEYLRKMEGKNLIQQGKSPLNMTEISAEHPSC